MSGFIKSLQILPSPVCILTTDAQLRELVLNCTKARKFGIMHLDPTFYPEHVYTWEGYSSNSVSSCVCLSVCLQLIAS